VKCFAGNDHGGLLAAQNDFVSAHLKILIAGNCVLCCFNCHFTTQINKMSKIFEFLSVLYVILLIFFVNSLLKQQSTQLPAMKALISDIDRKNPGSKN
jgi:hypothetical protein